jgi:hypothetical protein
VPVMPRSSRELQRSRGQLTFVHSVVYINWSNCINCFLDSDPSHRGAPRTSSVLREEVQLCCVLRGHLAPCPCVPPPREVLAARSL